MDPLREMGKALLIFGGALVLIGLLLVWGTKLPMRLGRLPGDIVYQGKNSTFYFPVVTCILLSVVLTIVMWIISALRK
jgi:hypothetical protein